MASQTFLTGTYARTTGQVSTPGGNGSVRPSVANTRDRPRGGGAATRVTAFEIRSGARTSRQKKAVDTLFEAMTILPFGPEEARIAAEIRQQVESRGQPIGMADYMIAAACIASGGVLLTRNRKHFALVEGLKLGGGAAKEP